MRDCAKKILVIDDDRKYLMNTKKALESRGYRVSIHDTPVDATHFVRQIGPDLVLLDIRMGDLSADGLAYITSSSVYKDDVPIVFYSSADEEQLRQTAAQYRAKGYIRKGDIAELQKKVDAYLSAL